MNKFLSIVTVHLNDFEGLENTQASLARPLESGLLEWVLVDGKSSPTTELESRTLDDSLRLADRAVSEPDTGIFDAMNKGTRMARSDYVMFLNAGDTLHPEFDPETIRKSASTGPDMIWGKCVECQVSGRQELDLKTRSPAWTWYGMPACHPVILFKRELLGEAPYDTHYRIAADYDLLARLVNSGVTVLRLPVRFVRFNRGGVSDISHRETRMEEHYIRMRRFGIPYPLSVSIRQFKAVMRSLNSLTWFRRIWRSRI